MVTPKPYYDLVIVGGGMVGASLACALGQSRAMSGKHIAVIEAHPFHPGKDDHKVVSFDARTVALSHGSKQIFSALNLWQEIESLGVTPIQHISVSDRGHSGAARLHSEDYGLDALGYVVQSRVLGQVLSRRMHEFENIDVLAPGQVTELEFTASQAQLTVQIDNQAHTINTELVVAADGGNSFVRQHCDIPVVEMDYHQSALIANVLTDKAHSNIAYERFTAQGPMALLPVELPTDVNDTEAKAAYALVWTSKPAEADTIAQWDDETFLANLQQRFAKRAGTFLEVSQRHVYPLKMLQTREHVRANLAIIGNAAHTLHPVAGQGFNLGLRDVAAMAQVLVDAVKANQKLGDTRVLKNYADWRKRDQWQTALTTDAMVRVFSSSFLPFAAARNLGLVLLDVFPPLKKAFANYAMGYIGKLPRLARGLPL